MISREFREGTRIKAKIESAFLVVIRLRALAQRPSE
jgi:hypothetical protein